MLRRLTPCIAFALLVPSLATGQDYPNKPIRLVVPYAPGAITDTAARLVAECNGRSEKEALARRHGIDPAILDAPNAGVATMRLLNALRRVLIAGLGAPGEGRGRLGYWLKKAIEGEDVGFVVEGKIVAITCSADAIIPVWAYMLVVSQLRTQTDDVFFGTAEEALKTRFIQNIRNINTAQFADQRVVVKGCGELPIAADAYLEIAKLLQPVVKSLMYGEPCSTVPLYKKR